MATPDFIRANSISTNRSFNSVGVVTSATYITKDNETQVDLYPYGIGFIPPRGFAYPATAVSTPIPPVLGSNNLPLRLKEYPVKLENSFNTYKQLVSTKSTYADGTVFYDVFTYLNTVDADFTTALYGVSSANVSNLVNLNKIVYTIISDSVSVSTDMSITLPNIDGVGVSSAAIAVTEFSELTYLLDGTLTGSVDIFMSTLAGIRTMATNPDLIAGVRSIAGNVAGFIATNPTTGNDKAFNGIDVQTPTIISIRKALNGLDLIISHKPVSGISVTLGTVVNGLLNKTSLFVIVAKRGVTGTSGQILPASSINTLQVKLK